jgi:3-deoxy-manno-octulosonate cytidylyltransferase (CMP-KDO synthetase)
MPGSYQHNNLYHHLGIYGYKRESLKKFINTNQSLREKEFKLEQLRALDNDMKIVIDLIDEIPIGVDTEEDLYNVRKELE